MKVICVDEQATVHIPITVGKIYDTIDDMKDLALGYVDESNISVEYYVLINDKGKIDIFPRKRFLTLREYNLSKLT
jgi:hypothetical protein